MLPGYSKGRTGTNVPRSTAGFSIEGNRGLAVQAFRLRPLLPLVAALAGWPIQACFWLEWGSTIFSAFCDPHLEQNEM
ncbi:hypothetical protein GCM10011586_30890 [Silvibacterium dinghuense]|nr:hypothetical protein GCM10011586_30890 [Silvibacterium dinghuense]